jgi:hypothetical protein
LARLIFPPRFQTVHFQHSAGVPSIEFQIHAAVKCRNRTVVIDSFFNDPRGLLSRTRPARARANKNLCDFRESSA